MMREYQLSRDNLSEAVQIFPEIDAIIKDEAFFYGSCTFVSN